MIIVCPLAKLSKVTIAFANQTAAETYHCCKMIPAAMYLIFQADHSFWIFNLVNMTCHVMSCHVMSCHVILYQVISYRTRTRNIYYQLYETEAFEISCSLNHMDLNNHNQTIVAKRMRPINQLEICIYIFLILILVKL